MSEKRKDKKGRILRNGESQRSDGRYVYKYKDYLGRDKFLYSWRLVETDKTPSGRRYDISLREKENQLQKDMLSGVTADVGSKTLVEFLSEYLQLRGGVKETTMISYKQHVNVINRYPIGGRKIRDIKTKDMKVFVKQLESEGYTFGTIHGLMVVPRLAFRSAVEEGVLIRSPMEFKLSNVVNRDARTREALTADQEKELINFVTHDTVCSKSVNLLMVLLGTGMRVSELCALTERDIDFESMKIAISKQLIRKENGAFAFGSPKTKSSSRIIPMTPDVAAALRKEINSYERSGARTPIDGVSDFIFRNRNNDHRDNMNVDMLFKRITSRYNKAHPGGEIYVTPHICRHTFCTKMVRCGMSPKSLQYIMGHSTIQMTLDYYTHFGADEALEEMRRVIG